MASGIEVDTDVVLRLITGQDGPSSDRVLARRCQILHGNIKMHLHLLIAWIGRPDRGRIVRLGLERQPGATIAGTQIHPAGLILFHLPAQQPSVEISKCAGVGCVEDNPRQRQPGCLVHVCLPAWAIQIPFNVDVGSDIS